MTLAAPQSAGRLPAGYATLNHALPAGKFPRLVFSFSAHSASPQGPGSYQKWDSQKMRDSGPLTRLCNPTLELTDRMATAGEDSGLGRRQKTRQKSPVRHKMVSLGDLTREAMLQVSPSLRAATHLAVTPFPDLITDSTLRTTFLWPFERVRCLLSGTPH